MKITVEHSDSDEKEVILRCRELGLLRCGKSTVVNLHAIRKLKSCGAGRIEASLSTGERLMISRHYAPALRERLGM